MRAAGKLLMSTLAMTTMALVVLTVVACNARLSSRRDESMSKRSSSILPMHLTDARSIGRTLSPSNGRKNPGGSRAGGYWYAAARYSASEHGGTHLDSPIHFSEGKLTIDAIPIERLIGPRNRYRHYSGMCTQPRSCR